MRKATGIFWKCNRENSGVHSWACAKCKVKWVKGLKVGIAMRGLSEEAKNQHTTKANNFLSRFKLFFQSMGQYTGQKEICIWPLTWKILSGAIQFRQQKAGEREVVAHLPASRLCMPPAPSAVVSGYHWLSTLQLLEAKNLDGNSTLPWQVLPFPFRWWAKTHSKSAFVRLYIYGNSIFPHLSSQFIMSCIFAHPLLRDLSNTIWWWPCRSILMES